MKPSNRYQSILESGLFCFLVLVTISLITTNEASRLFVTTVRSLAAIALTTSILYLFCFYKIKKHFLLALLFYISFVLYGSLTSELNTAFDIGRQNMLSNVAITLCGIAVLTSSSLKGFNEDAAKKFIIYVLVTLLVTVLVGGLELSMPPHFTFDYITELEGNGEILYSQGISYYFGLSAIISAWFTSKKNSIYEKISYACLTFIFLSLSLLGGARGDSVAAIFVVFTSFIIIHGFAQALIPCAILMTLCYFLFGFDFFFDNFIIFQRFTDVFSGEDYGYRDILFADSLRLLNHEQRCLVIGCGFGYFQDYFQLDFGMYPHNFILEAIIVFGLPISLIFFITTMLGLRLHTKIVGGIDLMVFVFLYLSIINLKSGYVFGDWLFTSMLIYFATLTLLPAPYGKSS